MTEKVICEKCGNEMIDRSYGDSIHIECPNCGWGWATTTYDPCLDDTTAYEIWISPGNKQSSENLRIIAKICHINFLQAKRVLNSSVPERLYPFIETSCSTQNRVLDIKKIANILLIAHINFYIAPDFPYEY